MQFTQVHRTEQEKVFISVQNNEGSALQPSYLTEFSATTTDADQGRLVELTDTAVNVTTGISAAVAGVVEPTIATGEVGRIQVYGPANVRAGASIIASTGMVATNAGLAAGFAASSDTGAAYADAFIGWTLENGPNATNSTVFLKCL